MRGSLIIAYCSLITLLLSCTPRPPQTPLQTAFYLYRFDPPAFVEFSKDFQVMDEIPFSIPPSCQLFNVFPAPAGPFMAIELSCPNGQTVLYMDTKTVAVTQPIADSDSHFLAWAPDGQSVYLRTDTLGTPHVARVYTDGSKAPVAVSEFTYDLASSAKLGELTFTISRGLGQGSELSLAQGDGRIAQVIYADQHNYLSFARFSPDGTQIAFIKILDTQTPFTVGELWVIPSTGSGQRPSTTDFAHLPDLLSKSRTVPGNGAQSSAQGGKFLAHADAGHGYAANWSPDGKQIAFVVRENPEDHHADQSSEALISNIYVVDVESGRLTQITHFSEGRAETPSWSPEGNSLAFTAVTNDRMQVHIADLRTGGIRSLISGSTCCPAWMRK